MRKPDNFNLIKDMEAYIKKSGIMKDVRKVARKIKKCGKYTPKLRGGN